MKKPLKSVFLVFALAGASFAAGHPARADHVSVSIGGGGIAFGYRDGYWDRGHAWHAWRNAEEAAAWRAANHEHYYDWRHDKDANLGWFDEAWWAPRERVVVGPSVDIAFGYHDGYWDRAHVWHPWRDHAEMIAWRERNREHYFEWRHDRDPGAGWREERWWELHR